MFFAWNSGAPALGGPLDFPLSAHPIATPPSLPGSKLVCVTVAGRATTAAKPDAVKSRRCAPIGGLTENAGRENARREITALEIVRQQGMQCASYEKQ